MTNRKIHIKQLGEALKRLAEFVPASQEDLDQWYAQAQSLQREHLFVQGIPGPVPQFLLHYLSDADIRMRDEVYADMQNRKLDELLGYLERGVMPSDQDMGWIRFRDLIKRWMGR